MYRKAMLANARGDDRNCQEPSLNNRGFVPKHVADLYKSACDSCKSNRKHLAGDGAVTQRIQRRVQQWKL